MQELKEFIKGLNVLYVEDELQARQISTKIFKRFFNSVDDCENGLDGFLKFQKMFTQNEKYDLIISDINMPKMDGLEMLEKIREIDENIPVIFVTARNESNILLKAIELNVVNYLIKPMGVDEVSSVILKTCEKLYLKSSIQRKQKELEIYLKTIEQITYITKLDTQGNITYINENFCYLLGKNKEDIQGKKFDILKHPSVTGDFYEIIWRKISSGKEWEGTLKAIDRENETIYLRSIYMPIFDSTNKNITEYIAIRYQVTDEENEKKELNKKMLQNIVHFKKQAYQLEQDKLKSDSQIGELLKYINSLQQDVDKLTTTKTSLLKQLEAYESSSLNQSSGKLDLVKKKNEELEHCNKALLHLKNEKSAFSEKIHELNDVISHNESTIKLYKNDEEKLKQKVKNLEDIIKDLENKIHEMSEKKGFFK